MGSSEGSISLGPWGGQGGDYWSFKASGGINEIVIHHGDVINSISFRDANGNHSETFGGLNPKEVSKEKRIVINRPSEYLTSITGSYGTHAGNLVIKSLSFTTNQTTYGPFGKTSGTSFSIPMEGSVIVGFHGRSGYWLDALGIFVNPGDLEGSISFGPWGGPGGGPWSFKANNGINQIVIHQGNNVKSISFRDTNGNHSATFGGNNTNDIGEEKTIVIDWPSEHLTSITGSYGKFAGLLVITSLSFTTNRNTYGPFGKTSGTSFSIPMQGSVIVGFHGRCGHYLDAIGIYVKPVMVQMAYVEGSISIGPWGGPGGDPCSFVASRGINQIIIHQGLCINSISFRDTNGLHSGKFGGKDNNDIGEMKTIDIDWPSEYLTSISGSYGTYKGLLVITSLSFTTNQTTYGPFGKTSNTSFCIPMEGSAIIGFHGRGGYYLDAIGIYVKPINSL